MPGVQVAAGRLRVDAARAIAKLREYQLEDKTAWVLEAVRAAVASGATRVEVQGDANDVWISWEGEPWPAQDLPRLFDELVSPEVSGERQHVRLLAAAVNSALGMAPSYVEVIAIEGGRRAMRARYTPEVLVPPEDELGETALHRLGVEEVAAPSKRRRGMAVHLRRKLGFDVLGYLLRDEPRELSLVREACRDLAVPIVVRKEELGRHRLGGDLLRRELGEELDGFLAVVEAAPPGDAAGSAELQVAERGVVLVREAWPFVHRAMPGHAATPIRLFLDAPQMPTNAARSQVRKEAHPVAAALRRAMEVLPELVAELAERLRGPAGDALDGRAALAQLDGKARAAALALLGGSGTRWSWKVPAPLTALERVPLVCDATGKLHPVTRLWRPFVYDGRAPLEAELAPWLSEVLWIPPGDASAYLVPPDQYDAAALRDHLRWARRQLAAQREFYARPRGEPVVSPGRKVRSLAPLDAKMAGSCVPDELFAGLRGEVCLLPEGQGGELLLFLEGRELQRLSYGSAIPFAVAIEGPFTPQGFYRQAVRNAVFAQAERAMRGAVIRAMEAATRAEVGEPVPESFTPRLSVNHHEYARTARAAAALLLEAELPPAGPLMQARAWRCFDGEWLSLGELRSLEDKAIGTAPRDLPSWLELPPRRRVVEADDQEHQELVTLLRGKHVVRYDLTHARSAASPSQLAQQLLREGKRLALALTAPRAAVAIAPSSKSQLRVYHCGVLLEERNLTGEVGQFEVVVESSEVIPDEHWERALGGTVRREQVVEWKLALVRALVEAFCGRRPEALVGAAEVALLPELAPLLLDALAARSPEQLLGPELARRLGELPLFPVTGQAEKWSARRLAAEMPGELKVLSLGGQDLRAWISQGASQKETSVDELALIDEVLAGMTAVLAEPVLAELAAKLGGHTRLTAMEVELAERLRAGKRERRRREHLQKPVQARFEEGELHVAVEVPGGGERLRCAIALARPVPRVGCDLRSAADRSTGLVMSLFVEERLLRQLTLPASPPVYAAVQVSEELIDEGYQGLPAELVNELLRHIERALPRLLIATAQARPEEMTEAGSARSLFLRAARDRLLDGETLARLRQAITFATVQGERVTLAELPRQLGLCSWQGEWLAGEAAEPPILAVPLADYELRQLVKVLHDGWISDVTESVTRLQGRRRHERGLMPRPVVAGAWPRFTRKLEELGELGQSLAPGELALVDEPGSTLLLHVGGELRERLAMPEVLPAVALALEDTARRPGAAAAPSAEADAQPGAEREELAAQMQRLAIELVQQIAAAEPLEALPAWVQRSLRLAVLTRRLVVPLMEAPLFRTTGGELVAWCDLVEQLELFDSVWALDEAAPVRGEPLDARRLILRLPLDEQALARQNGRPVVEASQLLEDEEAARASMARRQASCLRLPEGLTFLAVEELGGDGRTAPRGLVGILAAREAERRGLLPHRELLALEQQADDCPWPTVAVVDDARLRMDPLRQRALPGPALDELRQAVRAASARALARAVRIPDEVVAWQRIEPKVLELRSGKGLLHGALWIREAPAALFDPAVETVTVFERRTTRSWERASQLGLIGELHVHAPSGAGEAQRLDEAVAEVCRAAHRAMVKQLLGEGGVEPDLLTAHLAVAVARGDALLQEPGAAEVRFRCFGPRPLGIAELAQLFRQLQRVPLASDEDERALHIFDDDSHTARVLLPLVGRLSQAQLVELQARAERAKRRGQARGEAAPGAAKGEKASGASVASSASSASGSSAANMASTESTASSPSAPTAPTTSPPVSAPSPSPIPPAAAPPPHPLQAMLALTADRLIAVGIAHHPLVITPAASSPMVSLADGVVRFAGNHPKLRAIAAAHQANTACHRDAIDALVAHLLCLLHAASAGGSGGSRLDVSDAAEQRALGKLLGAPHI